MLKSAYDQIILFFISALFGSIFIISIQFQKMFILSKPAGRRMVGEVTRQKGLK